VSFATRPFGESKFVRLAKCVEVNHHILNVLAQQSLDKSDESNVDHLIRGSVAVDDRKEGGRTAMTCSSVSSRAHLCTTTVTFVILGDSIVF
jgi:hypothetical protein